MMKAKKEIIDRAAANGSMDRVNRLLSAAHLLNCEANGLIEETADILRSNGLLLGELKKYHNDFVRSADMYFRCFADMIRESGQGDAYFKDLEEFDRFLKSSTGYSENGRSWRKGHDPRITLFRNRRRRNSC